MFTNDASVLGTVYLIHFDKEFTGRLHYLGWAPPYCGESSLDREDGFKRRIQKHRDGTGSRLLCSLNRANIDWKVVMIWTKKAVGMEQQMKSWKKSKQLCPICSPANVESQYGGIAIQTIGRTYAKV